MKVGWAVQGTPLTPWAEFKRCPPELAKMPYSNRPPKPRQGFGGLFAVFKYTAKKVKLERVKLQADYQNQLKPHKEDTQKHPETDCFSAYLPFLPPQVFNR